MASCKIHSLSFILLFVITSCSNRLFPDKKLYQYPAKSNEMAVVYPDGTIHHSDGTVTRSNQVQPFQPGTDVSISDEESPTIVADASEKKATANQNNVNNSTRKDVTGRHMRKRADQ